MPGRFSLKPPPGGIVQHFLIQHSLDAGLQTWWPQISSLPRAGKGIPWASPHDG